MFNFFSLSTCDKTSRLSVPTCNCCSALSSCCCFVASWTVLAWSSCSASCRCCLSCCSCCSYLPLCADFFSCSQIKSRTEHKRLQGCSGSWCIPALDAAPHCGYAATGPQRPACHLLQLAVGSAAAAAQCEDHLVQKHVQPTVATCLRQQLDIITKMFCMTVVQRK